MPESKLQIDFFIFPDTPGLINLEAEIGSEKLLIDDAGRSDLGVNREVGGSGVKVHPVRRRRLRQRGAIGDVGLGGKGRE